MIMLSPVQQKVLDIYQNEGHIKAWNYWKLLGNTYGIFLGEVPSNEFIDGKQLANHIGLSEGELCNIDTPWLKFLLDYEIIYVPMKPLMHSVSWEDIYQCGAVYGTNDYGSNPSGGNRLQDAYITIGGNIFDITLLRGANSDPTPNDTGWDILMTHTSEWNRLMYPVHSGVHTDSRNPYTPSIPYAQWATYSDEDLLVHNSFGNGSYSWTQETHGLGSTYRLYRGYLCVTYFNRPTPSNTNTNYGWRPALRLRMA